MSIITLRQVRAKALKMGAVVNKSIEGRCVVLRVEAPRGYHWADCGVHEFVDQSMNEPDYEDILERMDFGVERCNDDCEWWYE